MSQQAMAALVLAAMLGGLGWATNRSRLAMLKFKLLTDSDQRRASFREKLVRSFVLFTGGGLAALAATGRLASLFDFPNEFVGLRTQLGIEPDGIGSNPERIMGLLVGLSIAAIAVLLIWRFVFRKRTQPVMGDVSALFPRNRAEAWTLVPLALNAGFSEEIFFRLALPLVATMATGSAQAGRVIACFAFGLAHWYQGWKGVVLTALISAIFMNLYLSTGSLLMPIIVHAAIDLLALVIRPSISLWLDAREARNTKLKLAGGYHAA